jgi:hypothetical protein
MPLDPRFPFWMHVFIETPAGFNFIRNPSEQLSAPAPQAHAIIQQYGALLLVSVNIALIFAFRPVDTTSKRVAGALALYHILPIVRAFARIQVGATIYGKGLGGPWAHLAAHIICLASLTQLWVRGEVRKTTAKPKQDRK